MDLQGDNREMVYKHQKKLNDICELRKDGTLFMISQAGEFVIWKEGTLKVLLCLLFSHSDSSDL